MSTGLRTPSLRAFCDKPLGSLTSYLTAALWTIVALQIDWWLQPYLSITPPLLPFIAAVMVTAWHVGLYPALMATALSAALYDYYFMGTIHEFAHGPADLATLALFVVQASLTAFCIVYLQCARQSALHAQRQLQHLHEISVALFDETDLKHMLRRVLRASMELLHADKGFIQLYDHDTRTLTAAAEVGFDGDFLTEFHQVPVNFSICGASVERKRRVRVSDITLDPEFFHLAPVFSKYDVAAAQSTPLFHTDGHVLGVLSTYFRKPHMSSVADLRVLDLYAHQAAHVLEAKRTEETLRGVNRDLAHRMVAKRLKLVEKDQTVRDLLSELAVTEQRERRHLAEELHDYLAQLLSFASMMLKQAQKSVTGPTKAFEYYMAQSDDALQKSLAYARTMMAELIPSELLASGLPAALRWLATKMPEHGLAIHLSVDSESLTLQHDHAILVFQSVRELLMNVVKHARVKEATVALRVDSTNTLRITVQDDGQGFNLAAIMPKAVRDHFGLASIQERMRLLGGRLDVESKLGQGTLMTLHVPLASSLPPTSLRAASSPSQDRVKANPTVPADQEPLPLS
jgi:signal transduction histidine kinase